MMRKATAPVRTIVCLTDWSLAIQALKKDLPVFKPSHNVILSDAKNLDQFWIDPPRRNRPEMFRVAQHDNGMSDDFR